LDVSARFADPVYRQHGPRGPEVAYSSSFVNM
jgi:hypothetical protein